jgi:hypothetical protein
VKSAKMLRGTTLRSVRALRQGLIFFSDACLNYLKLLMPVNINNEPRQHKERTESIEKDVNNGTDQERILARALLET